MPAGSRHITSRRSDSWTRSVGRSRIEGTSLGTLSSARRSPYWRLPSIRAVATPIWPIATARLKAMVVFPTPPLGENTETTRQAPDARAWRSARTWLESVDQLEAAERQRQHRVDAAVGVAGQRMLGHRQHHDRDVQARILGASRSAAAP